MRRLVHTCWRFRVLCLWSELGLLSVLGACSGRTWDASSSTANGASGGAPAGTGGAPAGAGGQIARAECVLEIPEARSALAGATFFDHPWPSDFRRNAAGSLDLGGFPNPRSSVLLAGYIAEVDGSFNGFSAAAPGYLRFSAAIDPTSLPADPHAALSPSSSLQLIDVDPRSAHRGERRLVSWSYRDTGDEYWPDHALAFMPTVGFPLRGGTRYALVVTRSVTADGGPLGVCPGLRQVLGLDSASGAAAILRDDWSESIGQLESAGIARDSIAHLTVFTTNRPTLETEELRDWVVDHYPAPSITALAQAEQVANVVDDYLGSYGPSPDFQAGTSPFLASGGEMVTDASGAPVVQRELELRLSLSVPNTAACPMPAAGYPVVLYGHGTGGSYRTVVTSGFARLLATYCLASVGTDLVFHGTRPGGPCAARNNAAPCNPLPEEYAIFNPQNPTSLRNTNRQGAIDLVQLTRLVRTGQLAVPAGISYTGQAIAFDPTRVVYLAHSQGAVSGVLAMAVDDQLPGSVFSGSAAMATVSLLERSLPQDLSTLIANELYGAGSAATIDIFHPAMALVQTTVDEADPLHYAAMLVTEPRAGFAPKSVLDVEGVGPNGESDQYVSSRAIEVEALALGLPPLLPLVHAIPEYAYTGLLPVDLPAAGLGGNLAGGSATGALVQWAPLSPADDPHFVIFAVPAAYTQAAAFLKSLATAPPGVIPPP